MAKVQLIFGRSSKIVGLLIRFFDVSPWSHVAIYDEENGVVYESVGTRYRGRLGRRKGFIKTDVNDFKNRYSAWRVKDVFTDNESWREKCEMMYQNKTEYDFLGTVGALFIFRLLRINLGSKHAHNCSEAVNVILKRFIDGYSPTVSDWWRLSK